MSAASARRWVGLSVLVCITWKNANPFAVVMFIMQFSLWCPSHSHQAYYGGEAHCAEAIAGSDEYNADELVCPSCSNVGGAVQVIVYGLLDAKRSFINIISTSMP